MRERRSCGATRLAALVLTIATIGCGDKDGGTNVDIPDGGTSSPVLRFVPLDGTTGLEAAVAPRVEIDNGGRSLGESLLTLRDGVRLETWPAGAAVGISMELTDADRIATESGVVMSPASIVVHALEGDGTLAEGWYALSVAPPAGFTLTQAQGAAFQSDGRVGARFRVGSAPRVRLVRLCESAAGTYVTAELSEAVQAPTASADAASVTSSDGITQCAVESVGGMQVALACTAVTSDPAATMTLATTTALESAAGVPVPATTVTFAVAELVSEGAECRGYVPAVQP